MPGKQSAASSIFGEDCGENELAGTQHEREVTRRTILPDQLSLDLDQFPIVISAKSLLDANWCDAWGGVPLRNAKGSILKGGFEVADGWEADDIHNLTDLDVIELRPLHAEAVVELLYAQHAARPVERYRAQNVRAVTQDHPWGEPQQLSNWNCRHGVGIRPGWLHHLDRVQ